MIILYVLIIAITLLILLSSLRFNIYNEEETNYIRIKFLMFTLYIKNDRLINIIRNFNLDNTNLKEQINNYKKISPVLKKIIRKIVVTNISINKYIYKYDQTYQIITLFIVSSYFKSYITNNLKLLKEYNYHIKYSEYRNDFDFNIDLKISIIDLILSVCSGFFVGFKNKNRSLVNGS